MTSECNYKYSPCKGPVEWHHPISKDSRVGLFLCQAHHSLLQGRKKLYTTELCVNLYDVRTALKDLELSIVTVAGFAASDIDKNGGGKR